METKHSQLFAYITVILRPLNIYIRRPINTYMNGALGKLHTQKFN